MRYGVCRIVRPLSVPLQDMVTCAVTTDGWVDPLRHASYTCVTAHYLDDKMQLQSVVLGTRLMTQAHTAENIFEEVASVLEVRDQDDS